MCGIFFSLSRHGYVAPDDNTATRLHNRGPDHTGLHQVVLSPQQHHATFLSTVLSLRGTSLVPQPLLDKVAGSVLCWNGEAWSIHGHAVAGNDAELVFDLLLKTCASTSSPSDATASVLQLLSAIRGPYAIVFFDAVNRRIFYGRDCLGRRSLLKKSTTDGTLVLSSVCDNATGDAWAEVEADGVYVMDLTSPNQHNITHIPHTRIGEPATSPLSLALPFPPMNRQIPTCTAEADYRSLHPFKASLLQSLEARTQHVREAVSPAPESPNHAAKVAVLFSGGLDCTILARLCHDLLPLDQAIDLLNVAFENPRIHSKLEPGTSPYELCPDRITGRSSHAELKQVCPGRTWRFVPVNVPYTETVAHRTTVMALMHPHNTEMDLSISYALYFASRGNGVVSSPTDGATKPYTTPACVLLSGLGADELFGGYQRHATAFSRHGYQGLIQELELDFDRLGKRNLGRDDRVISDSRKEVRFPFLDEDLIALALRLSVADKCDFGQPEYRPSDDPSLVIEPAKRILRILAYQLGMKRVATEKKRAIQFGARTAKMETGRTKGTHVLT